MNKGRCFRKGAPHLGTPHLGTAPLGRIKLHLGTAPAGRDSFRNGSARLESCIPIYEDYDFILLVRLGKVRLG